MVDRSDQGPEAEGALLLFSGQGRQFPGMLAGLYQASRHVRDAVEQCLQLRESHPQDPLRSLLLAPDSLDKPDELLRQTRHAQPALFITSYACARLWQALGLQIRGMLGHSVGEFVAAHLAGVWDLRTALQLVSARGRIMDEQPAGAMLAVMASESETRRQTRVVAANSTGSEQLDIAAINGPEQCVLSGALSYIEAMESHLEQAGVGHRRLATSHAFHSRMMSPAVERFGELVARVGCQRPERGFVSSVTGGWIDPDQAMDHAYWSSQIREPVRFSDALATLLQDPARFVLEAGPGDGLLRLARRHPGARTNQVLLHSILRPSAAGRASVESWSGFLSELAAYWCAGGPVDWTGLYDGELPRRVLLPGYPFERKRYWVDQDRGVQRDHSVKAGRAAPVREPLERWFYLPTWSRRPLPPPHQGTMPERCVLMSDGGELAETANRALVVAGIAVERAAILSSSTDRGTGESSHTDAEASIRATLRRSLAVHDDGELVVVHAITASAPRYAAYISLLVLDQELAGRRAPTRIVVLCRGARALV
ncbi:MAG: acyltransferase domain-containing protein, partial [Myxococcota bacterium]